MGLSHRPPRWRTMLLLLPRTRFFVSFLLAVILVAELGFLYPILVSPQDLQSEQIPASTSSPAVEANTVLPIASLASVDTAYCANTYRNTDNNKIAFVVKTTASLALSRLPTLLLTSLRCVSDPILISDLSQTLGRHIIHDGLISVSPEIKEMSTDFQIYRLQKFLVGSEQPRALARLSVSPAEKAAVERLDRWKWLRMVEQTWEMQEGREWYVFVEDGVYLSLSNLQTLLGKHDWREAWFLGHRVRSATPASADRDEEVGSGVVILSGRLVRDWMTEHSGLAERWEDRIAEFRSGRQVLTKALYEELGVQLSDVGTVLQPNSLDMLPFGPNTWCREVVSVRGLDSGRMDDVYRLERAYRDKNIKLRFRDIYELIYQAGSPFQREEWDNGAASTKEDDLAFALEVAPNDVTKMYGQWEPKDYVDPHQHFGGCEMACIMNEACLQFLFVTTTKEAEEEGQDREEKSKCFMSSAVRLGEKKQAEEGRGGGDDGDEGGKEWRRVWKSGWRSDRIERWVEGRGECG